MPQFCVRFSITWSSVLSTSPVDTVDAEFLRWRLIADAIMGILRGILPGLFWAVVALLCAVAFAIVTGAVRPEERINALWLVVAAACFHALAYRYYGRFLARRVLALDDQRVPPAWRLTDGKNYHPTHRWVLFGHHFAAIAGAGPLLGPVLAAQFGYLPGFLWLVIGAVLAGAV